MAFKLCFDAMNRIITCAARGRKGQGVLFYRCDKIQFRRFILAVFGGVYTCVFACPRTRARQELRFFWCL